jgi:hypothetical protein
MSEQGITTGTTAIANPNQQRDMTVNQEPFETGLEGLDQGDLIIPRLTITQPTTPDIDAANQGKFCINVTGDFADTMRVSMIKLSKSRSLFPEKYKRDNEPLCRSHDFKFPAGDIKGATVMAEHCGLLPIAPGEKKAKHLCPYANWGANNEAPKCQEVWNLLIVDLATYMPMWFSLKSTALKPLRKIISAISMISQAKRIPMWGMQFDMALEKTVNDSGTFYVPIFNGLVNLPAVDAENMNLIRAQLAGVDIKDSTEQMTADAPADPSQTQPFNEEF